MLCLDKRTGDISHAKFADLLEFIEPEDLLILNNTRVIPARLYGHKESGGRIEALIERVLGEHQALVQIKSSKSPKVGSKIIFSCSAHLAGDDNVQSSMQHFSAQVMSGQDGYFHLLFSGSLSVAKILEAIGHIPLPPYIKRQDELVDKERYQTVYATREGAVAAPTAGLHFDNELMAKIAAKGADIEFVTLHVGSGTFQPVRVENVHQHKMHKEMIEVTPLVCEKVRQCRDRRGRVIAVGTTTLRSLETAAQSGELLPFQGETDLFIYPGFAFKTVDALITNFHLPQSTLLMLVSAFAGAENITHAYDIAVKEKYRFFSYGDAMLLY